VFSTDLALANKIMVLVIHVLILNYAQLLKIVYITKIVLAMKEGIVLVRN